MPNSNADRPEPKTCDYCGSAKLQWVKCKLICRDCRQIVMSCADLADAELSPPE